MTMRQALFYNLLSAMTCYIGFIIGVLIGNITHTFAAYTFGFAGGM
jgi:zinc transporter ZupT